MLFPLPMSDGQGGRLYSMFEENLFSKFFLQICVGVSVYVGLIT